MEDFIQSISDTASRKEVFVPKETLDHPCDFTLVVEDGKEFKAHKQVLSEASPFFEKLLNSDMRESKEGVVRLEMLTEPCLRDILEFIYTGSVQILDEGNAPDLIEMADYLFLPRLKSLAGKVVIQKLDISNCISTYYFAERYQCEELVSDAKRFIFANFTAVANTEDFFKMSNREMKMCISSDEINVSSEEDVFKFILKWIKHDKSERKKYFAELFRHVRLVYVSRDFLRSAMMTNNLVKGNDEGCLDLVKDAMKSIEAENVDNISVTPRKSLETPVIVLCTLDGYILSYFPREGSWHTLNTCILPIEDEQYHKRVESMFSCNGQLYFVHYSTVSRYNSLSYRLTTLPRTRNVKQIFVNNEDEVYALIRDDPTACRECVSLWRSHEHYSPHHPVPYSLCGKDHLCTITKYNPGLNLWEDITTFDSGLRHSVGIVASDDYIYFIGGEVTEIYRAEFGGFCYAKAIHDANRYDLSKNKWDKLADIQQPKWQPFGASANGKVFITDGAGHGGGTCEVYNEATDEWQFIASWKISWNISAMNQPHNSMISVDNKLCVLNSYWDKFGGNRVKIQRYDPDMNEWYEQTDYKMPENKCEFSCLMRVFQASRLQNASSRQKTDKRKCFIM